MKCKFCKQSSNLIDAHIIPAAFFRDAAGKDKPLEIWTNTHGVHPKRSRTGFYDNELLCHSCDNGFGDWDNYAVQTHRRFPAEFTAVYDGNEKLYYRLDRFNYMQLKLFFIAMLWRAAISKNPFFGRINIGSRQKKAERMLKQNDPGNSDVFSVMLATFDQFLGDGFFDPHIDDFFGVRYARFYLDRWIAYVKIDDRPTPNVFRQNNLEDGKPLVVTIRDLAKSPELPLTLDIVRQTKITKASSSKRRTKP